MDLDSIKIISGDMKILKLPPVTGSPDKQQRLGMNGTAMVIGKTNAQGQLNYEPIIDIAPAYTPSWIGNAYYMGQASSRVVVPQAMPLPAGTKVKQVSSGTSHTLVLLDNGTLWSVGNNANGQLGTGNTTTRQVLGQVGTANDWVFIAAGSSTSLAIKSDGSLWGWGLNGSSDQILSTSLATSVLSPTNVGGSRTFKHASISKTGVFIMAVGTDGKAYGSGKNINGQMGTGSTKLTSVGNLVAVASALSSLKEIHCGTAYAAYLADNGTLYVCGNNTYGQVGINGGGTNVYSPQYNGTGWISVSAAEEHIIGAKEDGVYGWGRTTNFALGNNSDNPTSVMIATKFLDLQGVLSVSTLAYASLARTATEVWGCGSNNYGFPKLPVADATVTRTWTKMMDARTKGVCVGAQLTSFF